LPNPRCRLHLGKELTAWTGRIIKIIPTGTQAHHKGFEAGCRHRLIIDRGVRDQHQTEDAMLKCLSTLTTLVVLATGSANAQQREAVFQKIVVPGSNFDIVNAIAKAGGQIGDYRSQPDPNVVYLGNDLVIAFTPELAETIDIEKLLHPDLTTKVGNTTVLTYFVLKRASFKAAAR
jgi:hypothetical protein